MIEVRGLDVWYGTTHALKDVSLSIRPASFTLVGGPSGCGKSTLARALVGLVPQMMEARVAGEIRIADWDPRRHSVAQIATRVGLVMQNPATQLFADTVAEEIAFGPRNLALSRRQIAERVEYALHAVDIAHLRHRSVRHLSSGEQQRVVVAAALAMRPAVLILDEPAANLDEQGVQHLVQSLVYLQRQFGMTVVVIEHRMSPFLRCADRLLWLEGGRLAADGDPAVVLARMQPPQDGPPSPPSPSAEPLLTLEQVRVGYNGRPVLQDCSATLFRGDLVGVVGPNGAGKTTLARLIAGLLRPQHGRLVWHGKRPGQRVGLVQHNPLHQLLCDTVEEEVFLGPANLGMQDRGVVEALLAQTGLLALRHRSTRQLSLGEQQRSVLAATLSLDPALLILDEPTVGQDRRHLTRLLDTVTALNRAGQTVLLITHDRWLVQQYAGRTWRVADGRVEERSSFC